MNQRQFKYVKVWQPHIEDILHIVECKIGQGQPLPSEPFHNAGKRSSYAFRLEIKNGAVVNNISGSAVARDLAHLLLDIADNKRYFSRKHIVIVFSKNFYLQIFPLRLFKAIQAGTIA